MHLLGPAAMAAGDICDNRARLKAFRGNPRPSNRPASAFDPRQYTLRYVGTVVLCRPNGRPL